MTRLVSLLALVSLLLIPSPAVAQEEPGARAFEIRHRALTDAAELVEALLSDEGSMTLKPRLKTLVVRDTPTVLDQVDEMIAGWDLPPRRVDVTLSLFIGRRPETPEGNAVTDSRSISQEVRGVMETIGDFTVWTSYEPLGTQVLRGREGSEVSAMVTDTLGVRLTIGSVEDDVIALERLTLQETIRDPSTGAVRVEDRYAAALAVDAGKMTLVVAAKKPDSPQALFLALWAEPR